MKRFLEWMRLKQRLHENGYSAPLFKEGEVWWCHIGENIGIEIDGKSDLFTRPVVIFKKYNRNSFLGLPLSTKLRDGSWYARLKIGDLEQVVNLTQGRIFDCRRLQRKLGELPMTVMNEIKKRYMRLHT